MSALAAAAATGAFDSRRLRDVLGRFATGVVIVTARTPDGRLVGMTMNSFSSVSLDPPLVLFCVDRRALSLDAFKAAPGFAINILGRDQEELSDRFARPRVDKWMNIEHRVGHLGAPVFDGALAVIACEPAAVHEAGDHVIFVCRVIDVAVDEREGARPLAFFRGRYCGLERGDERQAAWPLSIHY